MIWCTTPHQRAQMIDPDRDNRGNQAVRQDHTGRWLTRQLTRERPTPEAGENLHQPHAASCPDARRRAAQRRRTPGRARTGVRPVRWQR